jgi:hypothetical protein
VIEIEKSREVNARTRPGGAATKTLRIFHPEGREEHAGKKIITSESFVLLGFKIFAACANFPRSCRILKRSRPHHEAHQGHEGFRHDFVLPSCSPLKIAVLG